MQYVKNTAAPTSFFLLPCPTPPHGLHPRKAQMIRLCVLAVDRVYTHYLNNFQADLLNLVCGRNAAPPKSGGHRYSTV